MSEAEKEAIEKFKTLNIKHFNEETIYESDLLSYFDGILILNLIEKLQKENKELKEKLDYYKQKELQAKAEPRFW